MITENDLKEAIAECQGQRNPNANTAIKLAAFLTIQRELYGLDAGQEIGIYSYGTEPRNEKTERGTVGEYGDSDFLRAIAGKDPAEVWSVIDELMNTLKVMNERMYSGIMRRLR